MENLYLNVESWASLSIMKTEEDIVGDNKVDNNGNISNIGFIRDQLIKELILVCFFQDYLPKKPQL